MIAVKELLDAGYKRYAVPDYKYATDLYQKRVRDASGKTLYFLNLYRYTVDWTAEVRLHPDSEHTPWLTLSVEYAGDWGLRRTEEFFAKAYAALGCVPDPHNQEEP